MIAPLAGRCFVLTRPLGQADALAAQLRAQGAMVRQFPVTEIRLMESDLRPDGAVHTEIRKAGLQHR